MLPGSQRDSFNFVFNLYKCGSVKKRGGKQRVIVFIQRESNECRL